MVTPTRDGLGRACMAGALVSVALFELSWRQWMPELLTAVFQISVPSCMLVAILVIYLRHRKELSVSGRTWLTAGAFVSGVLVGSYVVMLATSTPFMKVFVAE
jgi:hypothetical protein